MLKETLKSKLIDEVRTLYVPYDDINEDSSRGIQKTSGAYVPLVQVCNTTLNPLSIQWCQVTIGKSFLPTLDLTFDMDANFKDNDFPLVKSCVTVYIGMTYDTDFKTVKCDFEIVSCEMHGNSCDIKGKLWLPQLRETAIASFKDMTSIDVLKQKCEELGLGLISNIDATDDIMTWLQCNETNQSFICNHVFRHMHIANKSIVRCFIDAWYNLNVVDVLTEMQETPMDDDITVNWGNGEQLDEPQKLIFNNNPLETNKNFMTQFVDWQLLYGAKSIQTPSSASLQQLIHQMDAAKTDVPIESEYIATQLVQQSTETDEDVMADWAGSTAIQQLKRDEAHSNVHQHWHEAAVTHDWSQGVLDRVMLEFVFNQTINPLFVYKTVNVEMYKGGSYTHEPMNPEAPADSVSEAKQPSASVPVLNQRLSGSYIITALAWEYTKSRKLQQHVTCQRRMYPVLDVDKLK